MHVDAAQACRCQAKAEKLKQSLPPSLQKKDRKLSHGIVSANFRTKIMDFGGFDSSRILVSRGGILMSIGKFP